MKDEYTAKEFRELMKSGTIGKKGRLILSDREQEVKQVPRDLMFDPKEFIFIPGEVYSSKNSTQIRIKHVAKSKWKVLTKNGWKFVLPFIAKSDQAKGYQKKKANIYRSFAEDFKEMYKHQGFPLFVEMIFVRRTRAVWDFNNISQLVQDCMVENGWLPGDDIRYMFPVMPRSPNLPYYIDKNNPGVYIRVAK